MFCTVCNRSIDSDESAKILCGIWAHNKCLEEDGEEE